MRKLAILALAVLVPAGAFAQAVPAPSPSAQVPPAQAPGATDPTYVIGTDDILAIVFWELPSHGAEVGVRPDGKITLPLLNEVQAAGLTPEQLRASITAAAARYIREPQVSVIVKQINSRRVYVTGQVNKPGPYPLTQPTTVLQMIAMAGGMSDFAKKNKVAIMRTEDGQTKNFKFNYNDVIEGKKLEQNIVLQPGDTVVVP